MSRLAIVNENVNVPRLHAGSGEGALAAGASRSDETQA